MRTGTRFGPMLGTILLVSLLVACTSSAPRPGHADGHNQHARKISSPSPIAVPVCEPPSCLWLSTFNDPTSGQDYPSAITLAPGGDLVFITGVSAEAPPAPTGVTIAYSTGDGSVIWQAQEPTGGSEIVAGADLVYVGGNEGTHPALVAYNAGTGQVAWRTSGATGSLTAMTLDRSGNELFVAVFGSYGGGSRLMAIDAATGKVAWNRALAPGSSLAALDTSPNGRVLYATGWNERTTSSRLMLVAFGVSDGHRLWQSTLGSAGDSSYATGRAVAVSADGKQVFAAGNVGNFLSTLAFEAGSGRSMWVSRLYRKGWGDAQATGVVASAGRVFAFGTENLDPVVGFVTVGLDAASGTRLWTRVNDHCADAAGIAVGPDDRNLYVTGRCHDAYATISYRGRDGAKRWIRTPLGGGAVGGAGFDLVADADGRVFVTGAMTFPKESLGIVTIAYTP